MWIDGFYFQIKWGTGELRLVPQLAQTCVSPWISNGIPISDTCSKGIQKRSSHSCDKGVQEYAGHLPKKTD